MYFQFLLKVLLQHDPFHDVEVIAFYTCTSVNLMQTVWYNHVQFLHATAKNARKTVSNNSLRMGQCFSLER